MANLIVSALATWNGKALNKGKQDISAFDKTVSKLGRSMAATFSAYQILAFSKKAINAFAADEKAAKSLAVQLQNTGNAFRINEVEAYINKLEGLYGVLDDQLRPAFQTLLNATGSVTLSQKALETALNVSAGTGKDLASVVAAIAKGASGTTTSLARLGTGLDKATIASGDMNKIMAALDEKFKGQALARLDTYAGKMDQVRVATSRATETIGKGLLDALTILSTDKSIENLSKDFENLATNISNVIVNLAKLTDKIGSVVNNPSFKPALLLLAVASKNPTAVKAAIGYVALSGVAELATKSYGGSKPATNMGGYSGIPDLRTSLALVKARKEEYKIIAAKNAIDTKNLEELKKKFDLERIGLSAALNNATDAETKLRLQAQLAILDGNEAMAKKLLAEMEAAEALKKLAEQARLAGMSLEDFALFKVKTLNTKIDDYLQKTALEMVRALNAQIAALIASLGGVTTKAPTTTSSYIPSGSTSLPASYFQDLATSLVGTSSYSGMNVSEIATERARESGNRSVDVNVRIDSPSGDKFAQLVAESIQIAGRSGYNTAPAGSLP
jgi:phage shock protein A